MYTGFVKNTTQLSLNDTHVHTAFVRNWHTRIIQTHDLLSRNLHVRDQSAYFEYWYVPLLFLSKV